MKNSVVSGEYLLEVGFKAGLTALSNRTHFKEKRGENHKQRRRSVCPLPRLTSGSGRRTTGTLGW